LRREPVEMVDTVRSGNVEAASLAVEEVECLPDGLRPYVGADAKRSRAHIARSDDVAARRIHFGEVHLVERAESRARRLHGFAQNYLAERVVVYAHELEVRSRQVAGDRSLRRAALVAGVAERDLARRDVPSRVVVGIHTLQLESADLETDAIAGR